MHIHGDFQGVGKLKFFLLEFQNYTIWYFTWNYKKAIKAKKNDFFPKLFEIEMLQREAIVNQEKSKKNTYSFEN